MHIASPAAAAAATCAVLALSAANPIAGSLAPVATPRQALRCNPEARRVIEPLVLKEGDSFQVHVHFDYLCPEGTQPVVFVLAVEASDQLQPSGFGGRAVLGNVKDGLTAFVEAIDFANGSQGGLVVYTSNASVRFR